MRTGWPLAKKVDSSRVIEDGALPSLIPIASMAHLLKLGAMVTIFVRAHAQERDREDEGTKLVMV